MRLLLIACSASKEPGDALLPAIQRYAGGTYQVIRKARRLNYWPQGVRIAIVSARFGLIAETTPIPDYDEKMTRRRANELAGRVSADLDALLLAAGPCEEVFLNLGRDYLLAIQFARELARLRAEGRVNEASGGLGQRLGQMRGWLLSLSGADPGGSEASASWER